MLRLDPILIPNNMSRSRKEGAGFVYYYKNACVLRVLARTHTRARAQRRMRECAEGEGPALCLPFCATENEYRRLVAGNTLR